MGKTKSHSQSPNKTPNTPVHPIFNNWSIKRKLEKLEQRYRSDQEKKPAEIEFSSIGNPRGAAISYRVERLKQYVEEIKGIFDAEIEAGQLGDAPEVWATIYQWILASIKPRITSLLGKLVFDLMRTGGGSAGEYETVEEAKRELSRLITEIEGKLADARVCAHWPSTTEKQQSSPTMPTTAPSRVGPLLNYKSSLKKAILLGLTKHPKASDKELCDWFDDEGPTELPAGLVKRDDRSFASAYRGPERRPNLQSAISKVRKDMRGCGLL